MVWIALAASSAVNLIAGTVMLGGPTVQTQAPDASAEDVGSERPRPGSMVVVSIVQLLSDPWAYDGKSLIVGGYFVKGTHPMLFLHRDDADHGLVANGIGLEPPDVDGGVVHDYVIAEGIFRVSASKTLTVGTLVATTLTVGFGESPMRNDAGAATASSDAVAPER